MSLSSAKAPARKTVKVNHVFDIECGNWTRFRTGGFLSLDTREVFISHNEEELANRILALKGVAWAHNGGRYDTVWLLKWCIRLGLEAKISVAGSSIVGLRVGELVVRDSYRMFPLSLSQFAGAFGVHRKQGFPLACLGKGRCASRSCEGYCALGKRLTKRELALVDDYLRSDLRALAEALEALLHYAEVEDIDLSPTIGASAWAEAQRTLGIPDCPFSQAEYETIRQAFYGGRTEVYQTEAPEIHRHDLVSAYPWAFTELELPIDRRRGYGSEASKAFADGRCGVFRARVSVPIQHCAPLPVRIGTRVVYPTGEFEGWWTGLELRAALETHGASVQSIDAGVWGLSTAPLLRPFFERTFARRARVGTKTPLGKYEKLRPNSLFGKTAQLPETESFFVTRESPRMYHRATHPCYGGTLCQMRSFAGCCEHRCTGACGVMECVNLELGIYSETHYRIAPSAHVDWAAHCTAFTRVEWRRQAHSDGGIWELVYGDTDSIYSTGPRTSRIGEGELGRWDYEGRGVEFSAVAPKTYTFLRPLPDGVSGPLVRFARSKGQPNASENWSLISEGELVPDTEGVRSFKASARKGELFVRKDLARRVRRKAGWVGGRILLGTQTRAPTITEALERKE